MPVLIVGRTEIPYEIRWSDTATRRKIVVTPGKVEVVAPANQEQAGVETFVHRKRRWVFDKVQSVNQAAASLDHPQPSRYASGAKVLYRGRRMRLTVKRAEVAEVQVTYRSGFHVLAPQEAPDELIKTALEAWMKDRILLDIHELSRRYAPRLSVTPRAIRVRAMEEMWGSCGEGGTLHFDWRLIQAPKAILEYAVVHELAHLRDRGHGKSFWSLVARVLPEYEAAKRWLEREGWGLG